MERAAAAYRRGAATVAARTSVVGEATAANAATTWCVGVVRQDVDVPVPIGKATTIIAVVVVAISKGVAIKAISPRIVETAVVKRIVVPVERPSKTKTERNRRTVVVGIVEEWVVEAVEGIVVATEVPAVVIRTVVVVIVIAFVVLFAFVIARYGNTIFIDIFFNFNIRRFALLIDGCHLSITTGEAKENDRQCGEAKGTRRRPAPRCGG